MKNEITEMLLQRESDLRHYEVNGNHYLFDNLDMKLFNVSSNFIDGFNKKFVSRDLIELPEKVIQKRATYVGYNAIIELTDNCNLRCVYCYRQKQLNKNTLNNETAEGIVNHIVNIDKENKLEGEIIKVIFFGGEPLLNFKILQFIVVELSKSVKNYKLEFSVSTNGVLLTKEIIDYFEKYQFSVQVSFEGTKTAQGISRPFANGKNSYNVILKNIKLIKPHQKKYYTIAISLSKLTKNIGKRIKEYSKLGFEKFNILFIVDDIIGKNCLTISDIDIITYEIREIVKEYIEFIKEKEIITIHPFFENLTHLHTRIPRGVCNSTVNVEAFGTDGSIFPCQRFLSNSKYNYGNVLCGICDNKLLKIRGKKCHFSEKCSLCWMKVFCSGKCAFLQTIPENSDESIINCIIQSILWDEIIRGYIIIKEQYSNSLDYFYNYK